jgi:hypothetical protein
MHALAATTVLYLGKNTDNRICGAPFLFQVLVRRTLLAHVPRARNSLVCVGAPLSPDWSATRDPTGEEAAGLLIYDRCVPRDWWRMVPSFPFLEERWARHAATEATKRPMPTPMGTPVPLSYRDAEDLVKRDPPKPKPKPKRKDRSR